MSLVANIPDAVFIQIGAYLFIVVAILFLLNRSTQGFLSAWFKVRRLRGRKVLVRVRTVINDYFTSGSVDEGFLVYVPRGKKKTESKRLSIEEVSVYRSYGLHCVDVDDAKNCSFSRDAKAVSGFDAEKNNSLHLRALYKPSLIDNQTKIIIIILIVLVIAVAASIFMSVNLGKTLGAKIDALKTVGQVVSSAVKPVSGG
jgi:hypothetical protein